MSARNRKSFDDKMSTSPSNLQEEPEIEETPDLTGVANENSTDGDEMSSPPPLILQEASNSGLIAKIMTIAILMGIWICAWFFGFGNQIEEFDQTYTLDREHGIVEVIKDWMVNFISSILDNSRFF